MNLFTKLLLLCILISSKSFAVNPDLADGSEDDNLVKTDGKLDYKELMTFTYKELRDEVEKEMEDENEQRYQKALENKRAKLGLKEGDPGYDEVDVDYEEVYYTRLDTDPNYEHFGVEDDYEDYDQSVKEDKFDFHSSTPLERQLANEESTRKILKDYLKEHYDNDGEGIPDAKAADFLEGLHDLIQYNSNDQIRFDERELASKYEGRKDGFPEDELKKIEDMKSNLKISLSKLKKLQADAYKYSRYPISAAKPSQNQGSSIYLQ